MSEPYWEPLGGPQGPAGPPGSSGAQLVTTLPVSPANGEEIVFCDNAAAPTYTWLLRFNSNSGKWHFLGGTPLYAEVTTAESTASGTYVALTTAGPAIALPLVGDYDVEIGFSENTTAGNTAAMSYDIGVTGAVDADMCLNNAAVGGGANAISAARSRRKAGLAAVTLTAKYRALSGTAQFMNRWMRVTPIRVG